MGEMLVYSGCMNVCFNLKGLMPCGQIPCAVKEPFPPQNLPKRVISLLFIKFVYGHLSELAIYALKVWI